MHFFQESYFAVLHWFWMIFHFTRTICLIEPCHLVSVEVTRCLNGLKNYHSLEIYCCHSFFPFFFQAKTTMTCVCDLMKTKHDVYAVGLFLEDVQKFYILLFFWPLVESFLEET